MGRVSRDLGAMRDRRNVKPGLWRTLGYELRSWDEGSAVVAWHARPEYGFESGDGYVVQGGMVTALLDAAMGSACWTVLDDSQAFLTADLRTEFLRSARPGELVASGSVVRRTRAVVFCAGELQDAEGTVLAASRCTQVVLPAAGRAGR